MTKKLTRSGNSVALVLDKPILEASGFKAGMPVEVSIVGNVIMVSHKRSKKEAADDRKFWDVVEKVNKRYANVFKRLADA